MEYTNLKSQVEYGLEKVDPNRKIEISLKDFIFLHNLLAELVRFFHQPMHYETIEDVNEFLGNYPNEGVFQLLSDVLNKKFQYRDIFPKDIVEMFDNSEFENPDKPYYYKP